MARRVAGPDGRRWKVARRWLPWRPRRRDIDLTGVPVIDLSDHLIIGLLAMAVIFLASVVLSIVGIIVVLLAEWLAAAALVPMLAAWRVGRRKSWTIFAKTGDAYYVRRVVDWNDAGRIMELAAAEIGFYGAPKCMARVSREDDESATVEPENDTTG